MIRQKTIKNEIMLSGIGVHSGAESSVYLRPAKQDQGIVIRSFQNSEKYFVVGSVVPEEALHATVVRHEGWMVSTIEHLLAAIIALGIDNLIVDVQGLEVPILDGSALPFVQEILLTGFQEQDAYKKFLTPKKKIRFEDETGRVIEIDSATKNSHGHFDTTLFVEYEADFSHSLIKENVVRGQLSQIFFSDQIAPARTFGFLDQLSFLRQHGLARGASLGNTVVIGEGEFVNELRFSDECVRHKMLDLIGDLGLLGKSLCGIVKAKKTGHSFNRKVIEHFVNHPSDWLVI